MVLCLTYIDNGITRYGQWTRPIDHVLCARAIFRLADMSGAPRETCNKTCWCVEQLIN
jgi:hypothetical protein